MNGLWQRAADRMRDELGQVGYETWIGPLNFVAHQGSTVTVEAPNRFFRDWINERYLPPDAHRAVAGSGRANRGES